MGKTAAKDSRRSRVVLLDYLRTQIDELTAREPAARIDGPDAVHRMRVACRRLRSSMTTFGPMFTGPKPQRLRDGLRWVGTVLGPVRDVEVMRDHLHETAATLPGGADLSDVLADLDHELAERHSQAHESLIEALNSPRYAALQVRLDAFVTKPPWGAARHTLPSLVGHACARVDRAAKTAEGALVVGGLELHEVRKAAKRARYAAEVAGSSGESGARALAERMEDLQELLGRHQDSLMARALLEDLSERVSQRGGFALGLLTGAEHASDESVLAAYSLALAAASTDDVTAWIRRAKRRGQ